MNIFKISDIDGCRELEKILSKSKKSYKKFFKPEISIQEGIWWQIYDYPNTVGFFMLRGFEYVSPRFGVFIVEKYSNKGLGRLALLYAEAWCRLHGHRRLELTVHPDNKRAEKLYVKEGYRKMGEKSSKGHEIYEKDLID